MMLMCNCVRMYLHTNSQCVRAVQQIYIYICIYIYTYNHIYIVYTCILSLHPASGFLSTDYVSNEKRAPGWLGYIGDKKLPSSIGVTISHEIRIPINQPVQLFAAGTAGFLQ